MTIVVASTTKAATILSAPAATGAPVAQHGQYSGIGWTGSQARVRLAREFVGLEHKTRCVGI